MLAGRMKLKNFLAITGLGGTALVGGGLYATGAFEDRPPPEPSAAELALEAGEASAQYARERREALKQVRAEAQAEAQAAAAEGYPVDPALAENSLGGPDPAKAAPVTDPSRPWDVFLLDRAGSDLGTKKIKDAKKGGAWKVNLYQDDGNATVNRAKVDFDRDDQWDEKWTFAADGISRKLSPSDNEDYSEVYTWDGASWVGP